MLAGQISSQASQHPLQIVLEDVHWVDPTKRELIELYLDQFAGERVLIVITGRTDSISELASHSRVAQLTLNKLGKTVGQAIIDELGGPELLPELIDAIVSRSDGVPPFVED